MFLIDLNQCYFKIVNGGKVWTHELDDLQWLTPDNEPVHVRRGKEVAMMPLTAVHQWLFPFGPFDINSDVFPEEYIDSVLKRREPVCCWAFMDEWDEWNYREEPLPCRTYHCDGTCEICSDARLLEQEQMAYLRELEAERLGIKREEPEFGPPPQPLIDDNFGPDDIPA